MSQFPDGFVPPKRETGAIRVDDYRYYFTIPVAGEVNEIVEKNTSGLQGTYQLMEKYCECALIIGAGTKEAHSTERVKLKVEQWATWHPKHVNILIRWMNEHIFGLKGVELTLLERQSSSANTKNVESQFNSWMQ